MFFYIFVYRSLSFEILLSYIKILFEILKFTWIRNQWFLYKLIFTHFFFSFFFWFYYYEYLKSIIKFYNLFLVIFVEKLLLFLLRFQICMWFLYKFENQYFNLLNFNQKNYEKSKTFIIDWYLYKDYIYKVSLKYI